LTVVERPTLRGALRAAVPISVADEAISNCLNLENANDLTFEEARRHGLASIAPDRRRGLNRVTGEVAESVAELLLAELDINVFWHITTPGVHGVDLLFLCPDECVLALEVKGSLRAGTIPRLTPSKLRQMSREWLNGPDNPAMAEWSFQADDLYAGVMTIDLALSSARVAVSGDFDSFVPVDELEGLREISALLA
jgi:hypothetical protein